MSQKNLKSKTRGLQVININCAGIDLGSKSHWVCCPAEDGVEQIREFTTDTRSLTELADFLRERRVTSVAMESTGVYWIPLFELLTQRDFEVVLTDTRMLSRVPGRKTDVLDCQWIQQLHSYGLLRGAFRPGDDIVKFRALARMKKTLVMEQADWLRRMQKELDQMNIRVHRAVSDISGVTGMAILHAIADGERDPVKLAELRDSKCRKTKEEIAIELTGTWREEHIDNLKTGLKMYNFLTERIEEVQKNIYALLKRILPNAEAANIMAPKLSKKNKAENIVRQGKEPMRQGLFKISGADLTRIDGISVDTAEIILSEIGPDLSKFHTEKQFVSYLRLSPNLAISGGKNVHSKKKTIICCSRVKEALRMAAVTIRLSRTALGAYYRSIAFRKGASVAVFATARKLAQYIYRMLRYGNDYIDIGLEEYEERCRKKRIRNFKANAKDLGFAVTPISVNF